MQLSRRKEAEILALLRFQADAFERYGRVKDDDEVTPEDDARLKRFIEEERVRMDEGPAC